MKKFLLFLLLLSTPAIAQNNPRNPCYYIGQTSCNPVSTTTPFPVSATGGPTYSTGIALYAGYANPTDFLSIQGSATKTIKITNIRVSGNATANNQVDIGLLKRSTANTSGTPTVATLTPWDSLSSAATATVVTYGAAPTLGTLVGPLCACQVEIPAKAGVGGGVLEWQFNRNGESAIILRGINEMVVLNAYGVTFPAGTVLNLTVEWVEQ